MPTITVRALGTDGAPLYGQGQSNFLSDIDAVAQIIGTRLKLLSGEWWEDLTAGLPVWDKILVPGAGRAIAATGLLIQRQILGTPYVTGVSNVQQSYDAKARTYSFSCNVQTAFGSISVSAQPQTGTFAIIAS